MDDPAPVAEAGNNDDDDDDNRKKLFNLMSSGFGGEKKESIAQEEEPSGPAKAREEGLITLSGLPPAHWKNLFHLELVKERNKPKEPPKKPPSAPFFLQWRPGVDATGEPSTNVETNAKNGSQNNDDDQWDAVWSDDDDDEKKGMDTEILPDGLPPKEGEPKRSRSEKEEKDEEPVSKRQKVSIYRSKLASLLEECSEKSKRNSHRDNNKNTFAPVTEYVGTLGPSAIDVSLSTLCNGMHDLEDGLPLLILASRWLIQACQSRERFDAVNAYLHRFLHLHTNILSGIDETSGIGMEKSPTETEEEEEQKQKHREIQQRNELALCIAQLKQVQKDGSVTLQEEMQSALCLLRHFSRMV
jgi:U3 small nucleolar RNA-associated protein 21